jgi:hypothetical protein
MHLLLSTEARTVRGEMMRGLLFIGLICAVVVAGIGVYEIAQAPLPSAASSSVMSQAAGGTASVNAKSPSIPPGTTLAKSMTSNGYKLDVYLPAAPRAGGDFPILIVIQNVNHTNSAAPRHYDITISDGSGRAMDPIPCVELADNPTFPVGNWDSCQTFWNLTQPSKSTGLVPQSGTYHVSVSVLGLTADEDVILSH